MFVLYPLLTVCQLAGHNMDVAIEGVRLMHEACMGMSLTSGMYMVAPPWSQSWHTEVQQHVLSVIVCCKGHLCMITCRRTYIIRHSFPHYSLVAPFIVYCIHSVNNMNFTLPIHIRTCTYIHTCRLTQTHTHHTLP